MEQQTQQPIQEATEIKPLVKTSRKFLAIVAVFALIAIGGILLLQTTQQSEPIADNEQSIATWKVYTNDEYGFEVKYPESWQVSVSKSAGPGGSAFIQFRDPDQDRRERRQINLHISDSPTTTVEEYIDTFMAVHGYYLSSIEDISIGGIPAKKAVIAGGDVAGQGPFVSFLMIYRQKLYRWDGTDQNILAKILSTFRFVGDTDSSGVPPGYSSEIIQVKFVSGTDIDPPESILPVNLQSSVATIRRLSTLPDEELDRIGSAQLKLWFEIKLRAGVDPIQFIEELRRFSSVENAQFAPLPAPPS